MPRLATIPYAQAKATAVATGQSVVVYVGCDKKHPPVAGAVVTTVAELEGYEPYTILVCYPRGNTLYVSSQFRCPVDPDTLEAAVRESRKKSASATPPPPPKVDRLDWS
jgi:hypothetical protein